jgi:hypothetical protein
MKKVITDVAIQFKNASLILKSFNKHGYIGWLDFGSLLGLIRDGKMISWDKDIDISFIGTQEDALEVLRVCYSELGYDHLGKHHLRNKDSEFYSSKHITTIKIHSARNDYVFVCHDSRKYFWGEQKPEIRSYPWIDIYPVKKEDNYITYGHHTLDLWGFDSEFLEPLLEGYFMGNNFLIPNQSEKVLESHYTDSWRIPIKISSKRLLALKKSKEKI